MTIGDNQRMTIDNEKVQVPISTSVLGVRDPSNIKLEGQTDSSVPGGGTMQNGAAEAAVYTSKKLEDAMFEIGLKIKHHEDNIKFLNSQKNRLDDSVFDMRVSLSKYHSASVPGSGDEESPNARSEEETIAQILRHNNSAAGIWCQLKTHHGTQASHLPLMKDVLGVVAMLGKIDDDNLSRILSDYLGLDTMLAVVCQTDDGMKALETYDKEGGFIDKSSGLHGLGASIGKPLDGRFTAICLENLRPYGGEFIANDPQRRLAILKPRLPTGESPPGFLGFAVNMINIDSGNLYYATSAGHGLRETLFYNLFSRLQVYRTRADLLQAIPHIKNGAVSLDGGILRNNGILSLGQREVDVKFPKSSGNLPEMYFETDSRMKEMKWKKERIVEDIHREQALLDHAKFNFEVKKQEFLKFLTQSSSYATMH